MSDDMSSAARTSLVLACCDITTALSRDGLHYAFPVYHVVISPRCLAMSDSLVLNASTLEPTGRIGDPSVSLDAWRRHFDVNVFARS
ncbi:hypothetical protein M404DRAFT_1009447 [Pisolithus tinctorius Marx 270]|uniref:Uncharacterized protein n=1 Tax=Pisolithus tinctorius Marx 270 TaxID=870435 RepID=A0A0C3N9J5_PISTI|nr:hypothetical protein M404DRAFT_1009449 [Pisolithus tinctorius Marx 270]KIN92645.1 hypothetical protein M404DRAFT_1009447 [Pisolithus tinctorius Marx 270]